MTLLALCVVIGPRHRPTLADFTPAGINRTLRENIRLGLDLRGGSHLVMQVQVQDYLKRLTDETRQERPGQRRSAQGYDVKEVALRDRAAATTASCSVANDASKVSEMRDELAEPRHGLRPEHLVGLASAATPSRGR